MDLQQAQIADMQVHLCDGEAKSEGVVSLSVEIVESQLIVLSDCSGLRSRVADAFPGFVGSPRY